MCNSDGYFKGDISKASLIGIIQKMLVIGHL